MRRAIQLVKVVTTKRSSVLYDVIRTDVTIPIGGLPRVMFQACRLSTVDNRTPHPKHSHHLRYSDGMPIVRKWVISKTFFN